VSEYDNTNTGAIWAKREGAHENAPDFKVEANIEGRDWVVAIWRRRPTDNPAGPSYKLKFEDKQETHNKGSAQAKAAIADDAPDLSEDVPF